jgi:hypothetical protein
VILYPYAKASLRGRERSGKIVLWNRHERVGPNALATAHSIILFYDEAAWRVASSQILNCQPLALPCCSRHAANRPSEFKRIGRFKIGSAASTTLYFYNYFCK